jgi:catechol 2,3-dioxygenase-like lactoylglutathione lyase family enzyme
MSELPRVAGVYETVLYGADVEGLASFYRDVLGLREISDMDELGTAFRLPDGGVLLLFDPELAARPGRRVPPHGTTGPGHVAFSVARRELDRWAAALGRRGIEIDGELTWSAGGRSLYVRDPAGNSVELIEGEAWPP